MAGEWWPSAQPRCARWKTQRGGPGKPAVAWIPKGVASNQITSNRVSPIACKVRSSVAGRGEAEIFIYPGYRFRVVDALLTNFHLPQSTLLMLVCALGGKQLVLSAYQHAVAAGYRFYSYGDCMFVE